MRLTWVGVALAAVLLAVPPAAIGGQSDRSPASLVPADAAIYAEINLDALLGKTPETAPLRAALANFQSPKVIRGLFAEVPASNEDLEEALQVIEGLAASLGPRLAVAIWLPGLPEILRTYAPAPSGGAEPSEEEEAEVEEEPALVPEMEFAPRVLVVADVRDRAKLDALLEQFPAGLGAGVEAAEDYQGAQVLMLAENALALARGPDWLALGFPPDLFKAAADRAVGRATEPSLSTAPGYQKVMGRLPQDAVVKKYISAAAIKQLVASAALLAPSATFSAPGDEGLGAAVGLRVEEKEGRRFVTAYATGDLDAMAPLADALAALGATLLHSLAAAPMMALVGAAPGEVQAGDPKTVCLSNIKNLAMAAQMFAVDNADRFPAADKWVDQLEPYVRNEAIFKCPEDRSEARSSYGMNWALSRKQASKIKNLSDVVLFYETAHPGDTPRSGASDVVSPPRHQGGNNYGFADGHARWSKTVPNFRVK